LNRIAVFGAIVALIVMSPVRGDAAKWRHHFRHGIPRVAPGQGKSGRLDVRRPEVIPWRYVTRPPEETANILRLVHDTLRPRPFDAYVNNVFD
jgi:hypothetical protein